MNNTIHFDYDLFYNYYTKTHNPKIKTFSKKQPIAYFYVKDKITHKIKLSHDILSNKYIKIDNKLVHIKKMGKNELLFSIPEKINNTLWDNHFHFGKSDTFESHSKRNKDIHSVVFFHNTIQEPENNNKKSTSCFYNPVTDIELNNFENIECIQRGNKMGELFTKDDLIIIKEIISLPFLAIAGRRPRKTRRRKIINQQKTRREYN